jgi:hypothetical protein
MSTTRRSHAEGTSTVNLSIFLITLPRTSKVPGDIHINKPLPYVIRAEAYKSQTGLMQCYKLQKFAMSGLTESTLPVICGVGAVTCTRNAHKRAKQHQYRHTAIANWWTERNLIHPSIEVSATPGKRCGRESSSQLPRLHPEGCSLPATPLQDYPSRRCYAATHSNSSSLSRPRLHRPVSPQWKK